MRRGQASEQLAALLEGLLEPLVEERLSAAEALALLRGEGALAAARRGAGADGRAQGSETCFREIIACDRRNAARACACGGAGGGCCACRRCQPALLGEPRGMVLAVTPSVARGAGAWCGGCMRPCAAAPGRRPGQRPHPAMQAPSM